MTIYQIIATETYSRYVGYGEGYMGASYEDDYETYPIGTFSSRDQAEKAVNWLELDAGIYRKDILRTKNFSGRITQLSIKPLEIYDDIEQFKTKIITTTH